MFSLIIPTYNERTNIISLLENIAEVLAKYPHEVIVVDDNSPDGTWQAIEERSARDSRVHLVKRINERGLSSAVIEGFHHATGDILGVMDADHSHDIRLLPQMIDVISKNEANFVVGSRRIAGGGADKWPWYRRLFSNIATVLASFLTGVKVYDPMSGFFCLKREIYESSAPYLKPKGYKILLEILAKAKDVQVAELPYIFVDRKQGYSKLSMNVITSFGEQLFELFLFRLKPRS